MGVLCEHNLWVPERPVQHFNQQLLKYITPYHLNVNHH